VAGRERKGTVMSPSEKSLKIHCQDHKSLNTVQDHSQAAQIKLTGSMRLAGLSLLTPGISDENGHNLDVKARRIV